MPQALVRRPRRRGAIRAVAAGAGGAIRAVAAGTGAIARGGAKATSGLARAVGAAFSAVVSGGGVAFRLLASATMAAAGQGSRAGVAIVRAGGRALSAATRALGAGLRALGRVGRAGAAAGLRGAGQTARGCAAAAGAVARGTASSAAGAGRAAGRATATAASAAAAFGGAAGRTAASAGRTAASAGMAIARASVRIPRKAYFLASDLADRVPTPTFRPWYLAATLVVIAAVAGVPYARARLFTDKPADSTIRVESAVPAPPARANVKGTGSIRVTTEPAGAEVLIDGELHGSAPLTVDNLAEGAHTILVRDGTGSVRKTVKVREGEPVEAALQLRPGWLAVFAPVKLEILENGRSIGSTEGGRILTPPGPHTIELVSQAMGFRETRQVEIRPGVVAAVTIAMPLATIEIVAPADAEILVDGERIGTAPLGPIQVAVGTREILMRHPTQGERRQTVSVTYLSPARVVFE